MRTGTVVIGAGFGDEGKGLITDFETRRTGAGLVSRFNGGAQAGHTVHDNGRSHVFGHVGAGTFAGAMTHLSSKFLVNPIVLVKELERLQSLGLKPTISVDPRARVSTVYDMVLNSMVELSRGSNRHGSCGLGINETVTRHDAGFELTVEDLVKPDLDKKLHRIRADWFPTRMTELLRGYYPTDGSTIQQFSEYMSIVNMHAGHHAEALKNASKSLHIGIPKVPANQHIVLEGAQGLMLDEFLGTFPHVTRSMTGLPYALLAAADLGIKELQPIYVTRAYSTRHGAGELIGEGYQSGAVNVVDSTNIHNQWQGDIRYAPLNLTTLTKFIDADIARGTHIAEALGIDIMPPTLAVTCMDQMGTTFNIAEGTRQSYRLKKIEKSIFAGYLGMKMDLQVSHISNGPEAKDVAYQL